MVTIIKLHRFSKITVVIFNGKIDPEERIRLTNNLIFNASEDEIEFIETNGIDNINDVIDTIDTISLEECKCNTSLKE